VNILIRDRRGDSELTCVPLVSPVKSSVSLAGTITEPKTVVAQAAFDLLTAEAPDDPEKVQIALLAKSGASVGAGAAGAADTRDGRSRKTEDSGKLNHFEY
jgi:hypothetical protein